MIQIAESFWRPEDPSFGPPRLFVTDLGYRSVSRYMTRDSDRYIWQPSQLLGFPRYGMTLWVLRRFPPEIEPAEWFSYLISRGITKVHMIDDRWSVKPDPNAKIRHTVHPLGTVLSL